MCLDITRPGTAFMRAFVCSFLYLFYCIGEYWLIFDSNFRDSFSISSISSKWLSSLPSSLTLKSKAISTNWVLALSYRCGFCLTDSLILLVSLFFFLFLYSNTSSYFLIVLLPICRNLASKSLLALPWVFKCPRIFLCFYLFLLNDSNLLHYNFWCDISSSMSLRTRIFSKP